MKSDPNSTSTSFCNNSTFFMFLSNPNIRLATDIKMDFNQGKYSINYTLTLIIIESISQYVLPLGSIHTERVTRHAPCQKMFKWYSYITTVHTERVMTRLYIVYHLDMTRDAP
jgi:hypothetical protein